jgi:serine/threonine-protein kinase
MAGVYVARALGVAGFERLFAIKVLHPHLAHEEEFISMFLDEARLAARIRHPNVVPTIDISDTEDAGFYLVMDYIEGDHLGALLQQAYRRGSRLPAAVSLRIVVDALNGLAAAHNLIDENGQRINLVHRDISPHNVMVSTDGVARITDFGVAKAEIRLSTTQEGQFKGKLAYMAPEHASNGEADQRSDLFSMAIILWECLAGRRLFRAENHAATLHKICLEPIPPLSSVDPALAPFDDVLAKGLERDRDRRFQSAEEFGEAIEERASDLEGVANPRVVAKLVRELASEKLERDVELIRAAMSEISAAAEARPAPESAPAPAGTSAAYSAAALPEAQPPLDLGDIGTPRRGGALRMVGLVLLVAAAIGAAAYLLREPTAPVTSEPLPAPAVQAEPVAEPSEPEPTEPDPSEPTAVEPGAETASPTGTPEGTEPAGSAAPNAEAARATSSKPDETRAKTLEPPSSPEPAREPARARPRRPKPAAAEDVMLNPYRK